MDIHDWTDIEWITSESYTARVGFVGELEIPVSSVIINMGRNIFDADGADFCVKSYYNTDVTLNGGRYRGAANTAVYATVKENNIALPELHNGFALNNPVITDCYRGFKIYGANAKLIGGHIERIQEDGVWVQGDNFEVARLHVNDINLDDIGGDCVQIAASNNPYVHHNVLDHSNSVTKQSLVVGQGYFANTNEFGEGGLIEHNYIIGGKYVIQAKNNGLRIKHNTIIAIDGTERVINYGYTDRMLTEENYIVTNGLDPYSGWKATNVINRDTVV